MKLQCVCVCVKIEIYNRNPDLAYWPFMLALSHVIVFDPNLLGFLYKLDLL